MPPLGRPLVFLTKPQPSSRLLRPQRLHALVPCTQVQIRQFAPAVPAQPEPPAEDRFNKTGERADQEDKKEAERIVIIHDEYSKSGGDDVVAEQVEASFKSVKDTDPASQKATAGKGNDINPLEVSPATPEVSAMVKENYVERNADSGPEAKSAQGNTKMRKGKKVEQVQIDYSKMKMRGR